MNTKSKSLSIGDRVIASPADSPVKEFMAVLIDVVETKNEGILFIVKDQDDDVWQCNAEELIRDTED